MGELTDWDTTAANNNSTPPDGFPENMDYSDVNNAARELMAVMARFYKDLNGTLATTGSANTYAVTLNSGATAYFQGMWIAVEINATNTGASTINVNTLGAKSIVQADGTALEAGDLQSGNIYELRYDGTVFRVLGLTDNSVAFSEVTGTLDLATQVGSSLLDLTSNVSGVLPSANGGLPVHAYGRVSNSGTLQTGSYGVSSVVNNSTGNYTITLSSAVANTSRAIVLVTALEGSSLGQWWASAEFASTTTITVYTASGNFSANSLAADNTNYSFLVLDAA